MAASQPPNGADCLKMLRGKSGAESMPQSRAYNRNAGEPGMRANRTGATTGTCRVAVVTAIEDCRAFPEGVS